MPDLQFDNYKRQRKFDTFKIPIAFPSMLPFLAAMSEIS
jgi:hypothetical protein